MASISSDSKGNRTIQFVAGDGKRRSIRLGKMTIKDAREITTKVVTLNGAAIAGTGWDPDTAAWVGSRKSKLYDKLAKVGLVPKRVAAERATLERFIDSFMAKRHAKPASKEIWRQGKLGLIEFYGPNRALTDITPGLADDFKAFLQAKAVKSRAAEPGNTTPIKTLAPMTVRKRLQFAKMVFRAAARHKLIEENPFNDVTIEAAVPDRMHYVTPADAAKLLETCPMQDWRTIFALARWGGLRCPSEVLSLTWNDIDWEHSRVHVNSPKTAHHPGKEFRMMPLFPELRVELERAFEAAPDGAVYVVDERFRKGAMGLQGWRGCNLSTSFKKIIKRAGLTVWPRPFHNLRSSRQTELQESYPTHVVCAWLGNSPDIAREHYLQVTDEHFKRAAGTGTRGAESALQNPVQFGAETSRDASQQNRQPLAIAEGREGLRYCTTVQADGEGFEPTVDFRPRRFSRPVP